MSIEASLICQYKAYYDRIRFSNAPLLTRKGTKGRSIYVIILTNGIQREALAF